MDAKSLNILELPKILERLSKFTAFSAGTALAQHLTPTTDLNEARLRQQETTEARRLLSLKTDVTIGGARDVRLHAQNAARGGVLDAEHIMEVKSTLIAGRNLARILTKARDQYPRLAFLAEGIADIPGLVEAISLALDDRGEVLDTASEQLGIIRRELRVVHERLLQKLQRIISDPRNAPYLQEAIITQRDGRYVIPLKTDFKGRIRGVVHDQSASGATVFIEPLSTIDLNNEWREKQLAEREEIRRILAALSDQVGLHAEEITHIVEAMADLDLAFAKARYADQLRASEPMLHGFGNKLKVKSEELRVKSGELRVESEQSPVSHPQDGLNLQSPPLPASAPHAEGDSQSPITNPQLLTTRSHPGSVIKLRQARHPLLNPDTVVAIDVEFPEDTYALVLTGPNTGGKTVSLKTVGLLVLMAQCGLHIPVQSGSELSVFPKVFADIGDEQSIEQSLSTFSAHITNTIRLLKQADDRTLMILDELGSGTDPGEGSALARAILSFLLDAGTTTLVATHYPELKGFAHSTRGVRNGSVEFDLNTLAPTYHFIIGLPGRSNAFAIASRLGLDASIIDEAKKMVGQADLAVDQLLEEIHQQREVTRKERERAERARANAEEAERKLQRRLENIENERRQILGQARREAEQELSTLRMELSELRRKLAQTGVNKTEAEQTLAEVEQQAEAANTARSITRPLPTPVVAPQIGATRPIRLGDTVKLKTLNSIGVITSLTTTEAEVQVGRMRIRAKLEEVELRGSPESSAKSPTAEAPTPKPTPTAPAKAPKAAAPASPGMELDIRGKTVEEALPELERYLDAAYYAGLPWVRIIHGKGTGKLRQAVRDFLRESPVVKRHETGQEAEGGEGVTVVTLAVSD